jgi:hypothetical protein
MHKRISSRNEYISVQDPSKICIFIDQNRISLPILSRVFNIVNELVFEDFIVFLF